MELAWNHALENQDVGAQQLRDLVKVPALAQSHVNWPLCKEHNTRPPPLLEDLRANICSQRLSLTAVLEVTSLCENGLDCRSGGQACRALAKSSGFSAHVPSCKSTLSPRVRGGAWHRNCPKSGLHMHPRAHTGAENRNEGKIWSRSAPIQLYRPHQSTGFRLCNF